MLIELFTPGVATNLFVKEDHLVFFKHGAGRTTVFIKYGAGRTVESQPKFKSSSLLFILLLDIYF